ncbi:hypothetical protein vseg_018102 [Gypsophila vaccaria]
MTNLKIISNELIKPSNPTPTHLRYLKSSLFDHVSIPILMPLIFFYSKQHGPSTTKILDRLKSSLPATLSLFYPLAGRFHSTSFIHCNDEGVPYVETKVDSICLKEVVHIADVSLLDELLPSHGNDRGYDKLLLAIQVNTFACGGMAIGIKMSHAVCDAFSFALFVKTWSSIARGEIQSITHSPIFEIWKSFPPHQSNIVSEDPNPDLLLNKPDTKWFMFNKEMCTSLKSRICSNYNNNNQNRPSLTLILSAFIWSRIKLATSKSDRNKIVPHEVYHAVHIRPKVKTLSNSHYYFGNMTVNAIAKPSLDNDKSLCNSFVATMRESIEKIIYKNEFVDKLQNGMEDLRYMMEHFERESLGEIVSLGFSTLRSLPMYESDFGWGKPVWVTSATLVFDGLIVMIPGGASSDDTYAYVNLRPDQMACLEADQEFLSFVSKSSSLSTVVTSKI